MLGRAIILIVLEVVLQEMIQYGGIDKLFLLTTLIYKFPRHFASAPTILFHEETYPSPTSRTESDHS